MICPECGANNLPDNLPDWPPQGTGLATGVYRTINVLEKNSSELSSQC